MKYEIESSLINHLKSNIANANANIEREVLTQEINNNSESQILVKCVGIVAIPTILESDSILDYTKCVANIRIKIEFKSSNEQLLGLSQLEEEVLSKIKEYESGSIRLLPVNIGETLQTNENVFTSTMIFKSSPFYL
jgi:hypothetical protein